MKTAECEGVEPACELLARATLARVESVEPIAGTHLVIGARGCRSRGPPDGSVRRAQLPAGDGHRVGGHRQEGHPRRGERRHARQRRGTGHQQGSRGDYRARGRAGRRARPLLADSIIEIDNKSITHRPDLWGHFGMAREVAAIVGLRLHDPVKLDLLPTGPAAIKIAIEDFDLCPRYSALVFENVTVRPSPYWLQARLAAIGLNSINNIVDMTNFVMSELAQPMHAFDADLIKGDTIFVRRARPGEIFAR
jgi:phenylalanyl-tRNA synthetase beta chain